LKSQITNHTSRITRDGAPFDGRRFRNQNAAADRSLLQVLRWATSRERKPWPRRVENRATYEPRSPGPGELAITFVNHATFLIRETSFTLVTDPVWSRRASPFQSFGPGRVHDPGIAFEQLPRIDMIALSHNHYDHMDLHTLRRLQRSCGCAIVTTLGNKAYLERRGLMDVRELDWWQSAQVGHARVTATPAQHFAARTPFDRNRTLWAGFMIEFAGSPRASASESRGRRLFFTGDSGYAPHFADVAARFGPPDVSLIPIGAYEPRWFMSAAHMNPDEAVRAHLDLRSPQSVAMHFGCFQLTDEAIDEPVRDLAKALAAHGVEPSRFRTLLPGETLTL
jgi:L-ascorbate metabolism protein UlaG (beta-lactamase superfamily)